MCYLESGEGMRVGAHACPLRAGSTPLSSAHALRTVECPGPIAISTLHNGRGWRECGSRCSGSLEKERTELSIVASRTSPACLPSANNSCLCWSGAKWQLVCFASSPEQHSQRSCLDSLCPYVGSRGWSVFLSLSSKVLPRSR